MTEKPYEGVKAFACSRDRKEARGAPVEPTVRGRRGQRGQVKEGHVCHDGRVSWPRKGG